MLPVVLSRRSVEMLRKKKKKLALALFCPIMRGSSCVTGTVGTDTILVDATGSAGGVKVNA